jgi:polar amino acid transport system substrate-binding protein
VVIGLAVRKGNQPLLEELTEALAQIKQNGSYGQLLARYNLAEPTVQEISTALGN